MFRLDEEHVYRAGKLEELSWLEHGFGTRLSSHWPDAAQLATVRQIHSAQVLLADRAGLLGEADALISNQIGLSMGVKTADCLPILLADSRTRAVAAVHAGWRGVVQQIVPAAIQAMGERFQTRPEDLVIAIGPGIGPCCFEVGPEVAVQFSPFFPERKDLAARAKVDLSAAVVRQLGQSGVEEGQIDASALCTCCDPALFHSYRRDREAAGRMMSVVRVRQAI